MNLEIIPFDEFSRIRCLKIDSKLQLELISDMCRVNTLVAVKKAGSGHLGSSLSSMDIITWLYYREMNLIVEGVHSPNRDIYFSSKGHDVPGLYSVLFSVGILSQEQILMLRRLGGLDGHPDVNIAGIEANSGSLGMGISKGRGMAWAKRKSGLNGHVYVMTGDGEFQEGQNYEALQSCIQQKITGITVIMDHNKVQSDRPVEEITSLGDIAEKIRSFGWHVVHMDGHDFTSIERTFNDLRIITSKPKFIIADTIKGKGVSFMEHPNAIKAANGLYPWHAGAPDDESYTRACKEILDRVNKLLKSLGHGTIATEDVDLIQKNPNSYIPLNALGEPLSSAAPSKQDIKRNSEYIVEAFGQALLKEGAERPDIVVLDADLSSDCRLRYFENKFPDRFVENGIAEQDMVSMAGGLAKMGFLPVVNSFASFLASRSNEQIYNNSTEQNKIIYACHYAGLIPAGPGKSHQSIRDISLLGALPNIEILQPCNSSETEMVVDYCVNQSVNNCVIRMNISPSPRYIELPDDYTLKKGYGVTLMKGSDAVIISYGPVMLNEALNASELLAANGFMLEVINMPWLNVIDAQWLNGIISEFDWIFVLEDHSPVGGLADSLLRQIVKARLALLNHFHVLSIEGYPACGTPVEALKYHGLDGESIAMKIKSFIYGE